MGLQGAHRGEHRTGVTAPIFFNDPNARRQLLEKGEVYTLRRPRETTGYAGARVGSYHKFEDIGQVVVTLVCRQAADEVLQQYVWKSGFPTVAAWRLAASKGATELYRVARATSDSPPAFK